MPRGRPRTNQGDVLTRSAELVGWALGGLEREIALTRERLASLTNQASELRAQLLRGGGRAASSAAASPAGADSAPAAAGRRRRRKMSADARRRISERMTKLWAERRKKKG